jgi:hypothetical protein
LGLCQERARFIRARGAFVQEADQGAGKAEEGGYVLAAAVPQGAAQEGEIGAVNQPVGVDQVERVFPGFIIKDAGASVKREVSPGP